MKKIIRRFNPHLLLALAIALIYHGSMGFFTFKRTYDAYVHIFFGDHYARSWFDPWDYRWYTGFPLTSYPPGSQQSIALLSPFIGLQNGFIVVMTFSIIFVTIGVYRFSKLWVSEEAAGYAALLVVFASGIAETIHVFGQLPTMFSLGFLLNAIPYVRHWLDEGDLRSLLYAWALNAATTAGHHVTTLFGAIFFIAPLIAGAIIDQFRRALPDEPPQRPAHVTRKNLRPLVIRRLRRIVPIVTRAAIYGVGLIFALVIVVLPYWLYSKNDPITQVPIPHASRDSFIVNTAAGLVFFIIPWGLTLFLLPYTFYKGLTTKAWPIALSLAVCFFLGTGGTTPIPKMVLGGAYYILTLDRFTFWGTILSLPLLGEFVVSLRHRGLAKYIREQLGDFTWRTIQMVLLVGYMVFSMFITNLTQFRKFEPEPIDDQPILNFIAKDQHSKWRFLTLGFGDQMAWLSAQTTAQTVDGNYHSARRLPELTSTPVERLEGAKFRGIPGIGSLQQFLAVPEKYNLKFVFSNDEFYDPLLYFSGWHRLQRLENGIMVWQREDIPPIPEVIPREQIPVYQELLWGLLPMTTIFLALILLFLELSSDYVSNLVTYLGINKIFKRLHIPKLSLQRRVTSPTEAISPTAPVLQRALRIPMLNIPRLSLPTLSFAAYPAGWGLKTWALKVWKNFDNRLLKMSQLPELDDSPVSRWQFWINWLHAFPRPKPASPTRRQIVSTLLALIIIISGVSLVNWYLSLARTPAAVVQAYYDDIDFRRYSSAYARLDPQTRPSLDQYQLQLSVTGGLLASYGKLNSVTTKIISSEANRVVLQADTAWITALTEYDNSEKLTLVQLDGAWYIVPPSIDVSLPPDQFFRRPEVSWNSQGRRKVTTQTTAFADILDRPVLQILSARLVQVNGRYSVVGELINTDDNPADVTVTAFLYDDAGNTLSWYDAQLVIMHTLLPKEVTPFRVDFEGVAGTALGDAATAGDFNPKAYSPINPIKPIMSFNVYAKAVVTKSDLGRGLAAQNVRMVLGKDGNQHLTGELLNNGTVEAMIPHILVTYYDASDHVVWVDDFFVPNSVRPQRTQPFDVTVTPAVNVKILMDKGDLFSNVLQNDVSFNTAWSERVPTPSIPGYSYYRISVNYFILGQ